jgi:hypothetical protein
VCIALMLWKHRKKRPDLFWLNIGLLAIVPVQAVVGGITVWTKLNPWVVAGHFVPSAIAVGVAAYFVRRTYDTGVRLPHASRFDPLPTLSWIMSRSHRDHRRLRSAHHRGRTALGIDDVDPQRTRQHLDHPCPRVARSGCS